MGTARLKRQTKKHVVLALRTRFGPLGELPDFLLIGVPRGGTTACFRQVIRHPQVGPPIQKEIRFFDQRWDEGDRYYRRCFPTSRQMAARGWIITGEATPRYLEHPDAPARAASLIPGARLIVMLRDPVFRAWSHYQLHVRWGWETRSFPQAIRDELGTAVDPRRPWGPGYLGVGDYAPQLRRWFGHFSREQLLVLLSEEYFADQAATHLRIQRHLGIDQVPPSVVPLNSSGSGGAGMDPAIASELRTYFAPKMRETAALLGIDVPWPER